MGVDWTLHHGASLLRPGTVLTGKGDCYRVYTPYARACRERLRTAPPRALPAPRRQAPPPWAADPLPAAFDGFDAPDEAVRALWPAGESAAQDRLEAFADGVIDAYRDERDFPSRPATSCLSPYLAAGVLSPGQALRAALAANHGEIDSGKAGAATWINELLWREFYQHLLAAHPSLSMHQPMKPETAAVPWRDAPQDLEAWRHGRTGIPIVDAAMRQLLALGWMHNRLRMVTAMFLSKNLLIDWREGEAWFMAHLVDGDLAANNGGWQWSASTGADAVPYFRVFNPLSQSRKFDPDGVFLREWLPELAHLPGDAIHDPSPMERAAAGYPMPIVDLAQSRLRAGGHSAGFPAHEATRKPRGSRASARRGLFVQPLDEHLQFLHHLLVAAGLRGLQAGLPGRARAGLVATPQAGLAQPLPGDGIGRVERQRRAQVRFRVFKTRLFGIGLAQGKYATACCPFR